jgi:hypothetical protein
MKCYRRRIQPIRRFIQFSDFTMKLALSSGPKEYKLFLLLFHEKDIFNPIK